jgi:hypothetical protein
MYQEFAELLVPVVGNWTNLEDDVYMFSKSNYAKSHPTIIDKLVPDARLLLKAFQETELGYYIDNEDLDDVIILYTKAYAGMLDGFDISTDLTHLRDTCNKLSHPRYRTSRQTLSSTHAYQFNPSTISSLLESYLEDVREQLVREYYW